MREQAVVTHCDPEPADEIERDRDDHIAGVHRVTPQQRNRDRQRDHGTDDEERGDDPAEEDVPGTRRVLGGARGQRGGIEQCGHGAHPLLAQ